MGGDNHETESIGDAYESKGFTWKLSRKQSHRNLW